MLSEIQINRLYKFCVQHYVRYYDVQTDLVDHLAGAVEKLMQEDESLDFEVALDKVYRGFGLMGFSKIVSAKEAHLQRQRNKFLGRAFCSFFTIPKVAFTFFLFTIGIAPVYLTAPESLPLVCFVVTMLCLLPAAIYFIIVYNLSSIKI